MTILVLTLLILMQPVIIVISGKSYTDNSNCTGSSDRNGSSDNTGYINSTGSGDSIHTISTISTIVLVLLTVVFQTTNPGKISMTAVVQALV